MVVCELFKCQDNAIWFVVVGRYQPTIDKYNIVTGNYIEDFRVCDNHAYLIQREPYKYLADRVLIKPMSDYAMCPNCNRNGIPEDDIWCIPCQNDYQELNTDSRKNASSPTAPNSRKLLLSPGVLNKISLNNTIVSTTQGS